MKLENKISDLLPNSFCSFYPDTSVEYAVAYVLHKAGVKKLSFGSFGPRNNKKIGFTSITAKPYVPYNGSPLLLEVLRHFGFAPSGGASSESPSYMQASFLYKATAPSYVKGRHIVSLSEGEFLSRVYATFYWLKEGKPT